ncbi:MAG: hypothetical protein JO025_03615 [Verrucomicrobia bacterium]|nr:hypothetical protein [Verrucomicrobiota bacterium]
MKRFEAGLTAPLSWYFRLLPIRSPMNNRRQRFVIGIPKINKNQVIIGAGRITANAEKALDEIRAKENPANAM